MKSAWGYGQLESRRNRPNSGGSLHRRLCTNQRGYEEIKVGWVDVADSDDAQVRSSGGAEREARAGVRKRGKDGAGDTLHEEDGNLVFVDGEKEQGGGLIVSGSQAGERAWSHQGQDHSRSQSSGYR